MVIDIFFTRKIHFVRIPNAFLKHSDDTICRIGGIV